MKWCGLDSYSLGAGQTEGCFEHGNENSSLIKIYKSFEHDSFRIALMEAVGLLQRDYTTLYSRKLSYSLPWQPKISHWNLVRIFFPPQQRFFSVGLVNS
jgi:hypothetical protein